MTSGAVQIFNTNQYKFILDVIDPQIFYTNQYIFHIGFDISAREVTR